MNPLHTKQTIAAALASFGTKPLAATATALFEADVPFKGMVAKLG